MPESRRHASRRKAPQLLRRGHGATLLGRSAKQLVRNQATGRVLPCCLTVCESDGDNRYQVQVPHDDPRWIDKKAGTQEMLIYIFCSDPHRQLWKAMRSADRGVPTP